MKITLTIISLLSIAVFSYAGQIPAPPPLPGETVVEQDYFQKIYENMNNLTEVTTNPDGTTKGKKGDMLLLYTGGLYYLEINTDGSTTWRGVQLTNIP